MEEHKPASAVAPGDVVRIVDEHYAEHLGLVTTVHGEFGAEYGGTAFVPCVNTVHVSRDASKRDPYGQQVERLSSLQHYSQGPNAMPTPGRYWENV